MDSIWVLTLSSGGSIGGSPPLGTVVTGAPEASVALTLLLALTGVLGLAVRGDPDSPIEQLTAKIRRAVHDPAQIDFSTERDDEIGDLYDAVGDFVSTYRDRHAEDEDYRKRLYKITSDPDLDDEEKIDRLLELGCERLSTDNGIISIIDQESGRYEFERVVGSDFVSGDTVADLEETFCRKTITSDEALGIYNAIGEGYGDDPAYAEWNISCYVGSKIIVDDELYGTLCFIDEEPHQTAFTHAEKAFVDLMSRWVSNAIERRERISKLDRDSTLLDSLFEQLPTSIYVKDEEGRHVRKSLSDRADEYPDDEEWFIGKTDLEIYPEEQAKETHADDMAVIESGEPILREIERDPSTEEWLLTSKVPWRDKDGEVRGLIGITQYITEQKEYERRLEAIVETKTNPIYIKDRDGVYQFANEATAGVFGLEPGDVLGKTDAELFGADTGKEISENDRRVIEEGTTLTTELESKIDGEHRVWLNNKYPYRDENGDIIGLMGISQDITEHREREQMLHERERELSTLIENVPGIVYRCKNEPDWPFEFVGEGCRELTGYEPSALLSGSVDWAEEVLVGENEELWETVQRAIDNRERFQVTYQIETADGQRRWLWEQGTGVYADDGTVEALEGVILDITERKEREQELRETNERLNTLIEASPDALVAMDTEMNVELWNPAVERIFGWSEEEVLGQPLPFIPDHRAEEADALFERLLSGESIEAIETQRLTKDGDLVDVSLSAAAFRDATGEIAGAMGVMEDITERKRNERQVRERERELNRYREFTEDVLDAVDDVFYVLDADGQLERWNNSHREVTGYSDEETESRHATDFFPPAHRDRIAEAIETVLQTGNTVVEAPFLTRDGEQIPHEFVAVAIDDPDGNPVVAGIGRDISERKRREQELERTTDLLDRAEQMAEIGGWSSIISNGERESTEWTDKLYDIFEVPRDEAPPVDETFQFFDPDDRDRHREAVERASEMGVGWDQELRLTTAEGTERWVQNIGEPVLDDGEVVEIRGSVQDITEQKRRELALESLHEATRELLTTETIEDATSLIVETAESILDLDAIGIYRYDESTNLLEPSALSSTFEEYCDGGARAVGPGTESFLWHSYVTGSLTLLDDVDTPEAGSLFVKTITSGIVVPIGSYGVFVAVADSGRVGESDRHLVETLVATAEAAFDRIDSESALREHEAEIEAQNEQLRRQIRINETIRSVDRSLIDATSRAELEADVCERLVASEDIAFAWIGNFETNGEQLRASSWAGDGQAYLDTASLERNAAAPEPAVDAAVDGDPAVVENVSQNVQRDAWRQAALASGFQSALAVPITLDEYNYGVLAVYATEPGAFGDLETAVFAELGESIANALTGITTKQALHSDRSTLLALRVDDESDLLTEIAAEAGCTVAYEGLATTSSDETRLFVRTSGCDPSAVTAVLDDRHSVRHYQLVSQEDETAVFELTIQRETLVSRLVRHGGRVQSIVADPAGLDIEVDVPVTTDVRSFVEMLGEDADVELVSRTEHTRSLQTRQALVGTIVDDLTDRQHEVLRTAYFSGFFNWPRDTTGEELATILDVSQPTVNRHLRLGQQRIMRQLFDTAGEDE